MANSLKDNRHWYSGLFVLLFFFCLAETKPLCLSFYPSSIAHFLPIDLLSLIFFFIYNFLFYIKLCVCSWSSNNNFIYDNALDMGSWNEAKFFAIFMTESLSVFNSKTDFNYFFLIQHIQSCSLIYRRLNVDDCWTFLK